MRSHTSDKKPWRWALLGVGLAALLALGAIAVACSDDEEEDGTPTVTGSTSR